MTAALFNTYFGASFKMNLVIILTVALAYSSVTASEDLLELMPEKTIHKAKGENVVVTCIGKASNVTDFKWLNPQNRTITGAPISGLSQPKIEISKFQDSGLTMNILSLQNEDEGVYTCTAQVGAETLSKSTMIKPYKGITWVDAATEQVASRGANFKLKCKVDADPAPTISWFNEKFEPIQTGGRYVVESDGLLIQNVQETDDGSYKCRALIIHPTISDSKSITIHLEVTVPPTFVDGATTKTEEVVEGEPATLVCKAQGKPQPTVSWIRTSNQKNLTAGADGMLYIAKVTKDDDGGFRCSARNKAGTTDRFINLKVLRKPEVIEVKNSSVVEGKPAGLTCYASGYPVPTISIKKKAGDMIHHSTFGTTNTISVTDESKSLPRTTSSTELDRERHNTAFANLNFTFVERYDNGLYECVASNKIGTSMKYLYLGVEFAPTFANTGHNLNKMVTWKQRPVNLTCIAESIPNATITWFFNNRDIENDRNYVKFGNGPESSLQVTPYSPLYYGSYRCCGQNIHGKACHEIRLHEGRIPGPINEVKMEVVTATTITFRFEGPNDNGGLPINAFVVEYKRIEEGWNDAKNKTWPAGSSYVLEGLTPKYTYNFRFAASNEVGLSTWGGHSEREMPERSTPNIPEIINPIVPGNNYMASLYDKSFELRWVIPADNGVPIDQYEITTCAVIKKGDTYIDDSPSQCDSLKLEPTLAPAFKLTNLKPDSFYVITLRARNRIGFSNPSTRYLKTQPGSLRQADMTLNSAVIIYIVIAVVIALLVIVDISCFFIGNTGLLYLIFKCCCGKKDKKPDEKLGSEGKDLISNGHGKKGDVEENPLMINDGKKDTAVEYDVKKGVSKTGFIGKDSAV